MKKNNNTLKGTSQGLALAIVLVLLLLVSLVGAGLLILANSHYKLTQHLIDSTKAFYLAEAGIHRGLYKMRIEAAPSDQAGAGAWLFEGTNIDITFVGADPTYTITATTQAASSPGGVVRRIRVDATRGVNPTPPPPYNITSVDNWQEIIP